MYRNRNRRQNTVGIIRYSCGFLFIAFVFCYLAFLRGEVLAEVQHVLSNGLTHYSVYIGAFIITALLQLLQLVVSRLIRVPDKCYFLTYVPSFVALAMLIGMDQNMDGKFVWGVWRWLLPLIILAWLIVLFILRRFEFTEKEDRSTTIQSRMWPNYMMLLAMICACGFVSNTPAVDQYELKTERLLLQKNYEAAAAVGIQSLDATERLTQLRAYALSKQGLLGDSLFTYPQYYGESGLLDIHDTVSSRRFPMENIEYYLGGAAGQSVKSNQRFLEILALEDSVPSEQSRQYLLCHYLLCRNLHSFDKTLHTVYGDTIKEMLPRHYQEAVIMQHAYTPDSLPIYINKVYVERFAQYDSLKRSITDPVERKNRTRRVFGDTYWWYYENQTAQTSW